MNVKKQVITETMPKAQERKLQEIRIREKFLQN
jgi:hypothetical protein